MYRLLLLIFLLLFDTFKGIDSNNYDLVFKEVKNLRSKEEDNLANQKRIINNLVYLTNFSCTSLGLQYPYNVSVTLEAKEDFNAEIVELLSGVYISSKAHLEGLYELALIFQEGFFVPKDYRIAHKLIEYASSGGLAEAQSHMAMRYSYGLQVVDAWDELGIKEFFEPDEAAAVLHHYFAALGGSSQSRMALGYRHMYGIGVPKSCVTAANYFRPAAEEVADLSARPDGALPVIERPRLQIQASRPSRPDRRRELVQFYAYSADRGNVNAQTAVGQVLTYGTRGVTRNPQRARRYLESAAQAGDTEAMVHLANMLANGHGVSASDPTAATTWFQRAANEGNANAMAALGYLYLTGSGGVPVDEAAAVRMLNSAAEAGQPDAHFILGTIFEKGMGGFRKSPHRAFSHFSLAATAGRPLAMYNAAVMQLAGRGTIKSCPAAAALLKALVERGPAAQVLQEGNEAFFDSRYGDALVMYLIAAEVGMELGQANGAWMLDRGYGIGLSSPRLTNLFLSPRHLLLSSSLSPSSSSASLPSSLSLSSPSTPAALHIPASSTSGIALSAAARLYQRSAEQGSHVSLLSLGDAYFYGRGVRQSWVRAAAVYYEAFEERAPEAMFSLGFMHEYGAGVFQDLDLAGRFYRMAKQAHPPAFAPVNVALTWLVVHDFWDTRVRPALRREAKGEIVGVVQFLDEMFTLKPPYTTLLSAWSQRLWRLLRQLGWKGGEDPLPRVNLADEPLGQEEAVIGDYGNAEVGEGGLGQRKMELEARSVKKMERKDDSLSSGMNNGMSNEGGEEDMSSARASTRSSTATTSTITTTTTTTTTTTIPTVTVDPRNRNSKWQANGLPVSAVFLKMESMFWNSVDFVSDVWDDQDDDGLTSAWLLSVVLVGLWILRRINREIMAINGEAPRRREERQIVREVEGAIGEEEGEGERGGGERFVAGEEIRNGEEVNNELQNHGNHNNDSIGVAVDHFGSNTNANINVSTNVNSNVDIISNTNIIINSSSSNSSIYANDNHNGDSTVADTLSTRTVERLSSPFQGAEQQEEAQSSTRPGSDEHEPSSSEEALFVTNHSYHNDNIDSNINVTDLNKAVNMEKKNSGKNIIPSGPAEEDTLADSDSGSIRKASIAKSVPRDSEIYTESTKHVISKNILVNEDAIRKEENSSNTK